MANAIFTALLKNKIEAFVHAFSTLSKKLFYDEDSRALIHPGEYGMYKEEIVRGLIGMFVSELYRIDTGFVINSIDDISSQIDIVIYNPLATPRIEDADHKRFYPIECVCGIGEVKTNIRSKAELRDAMLPLAKVKKMANAKHFRNATDRTVNPFTFIYCEEIRAKPVEIESWIVDIYSESCIEQKYWHNEIVSIRSGLFKYATPADIDINGRKIKKHAIVSSPTIANDQHLKIHHMKPKENGHHLISFGHDLSLEFGRLRNTMYPDIISYTDEYR